MPIPYVWLLCGYSHTAARLIVSAYNKCDVQLIKVVPNDGLTQSIIKHIQWKIKSNHKNFVHLVGLYTYCKMMHGAYNIKLKI